MDKRPSKLIPSLIGGAVIGVLSTIPIISLGNCLCCMWVLLGGGLAVFLYQKDLPPDAEFPSGDAAIVGLLAGLFGALFGTFLTYFFMAIWGFEFQQGLIDWILESGEELTPEVEDFLYDLRDSEGLNMMFVFIRLFGSLLINSIFGLLGGILGHAIFKKKPPAEKAA
jgi:hypothetical protein